MERNSVTLNFHRQSLYSNFLKRYLIAIKEIFLFSWLKEKLPIKWMFPNGTKLHEAVQVIRRSNIYSSGLKDQLSLKKLNFLRAEKLALKILCWNFRFTSRCSLDAHNSKTFRIQENSYQILLQTSSQPKQDSRIFKWSEHLINN